MAKGRMATGANWACAGGHFRLTGARLILYKGCVLARRREPRRRCRGEGRYASGGQHAVHL